MNSRPAAAAIGQEARCGGPGAPPGSDITAAIAAFVVFHPGGPHYFLLEVGCDEFQKRGSLFLPGPLNN